MSDEQNTEVVHPVVITYDIRDVLDRLGKDMAGGFATMSAKLDSKADKSDVAALQKDIVHVQERVSRLENDNETRHKIEETHEHHSQAEETRRERKRDRFLAVLLVAVTAVASLGPLGVHV